MILHLLTYVLTVFVSAFLLFQVQPLIARSILPWLGGGPAVWTSSILFFQDGRQRADPLQRSSLRALLHHLPKRRPPNRFLTRGCRIPRISRATPDIEVNFLRYLAAAYLETAFLVEGARTQLLVDQRFEVAEEQPPE